MSTDATHALSLFFGGRVCLDFANTMDWRTSAAPQELVPDYATLLAWSGLRGTLPAPAITRLRAQAKRKAAAAAVVIDEGRALRAEIWDASEALRRRGRVALAAFHRRLAALPPPPPLVPPRARYVHALPRVSPVRPLWPR